jgi:hypothetical protein
MYPEFLCAQRHTNGYRTEKSFSGGHIRMESTTNFPDYNCGALCCNTFSYFMCNLFLKVVLCMVLFVFGEGTTYLGFEQC